MENFEALRRGDAARAKGAELMVFDWDEAARRIRKVNADNASAGLQGDWELTGGDILVDGEIPEDRSTYLASVWAIPEIEIEGGKSPCWKYAKDTPGWDEHTFWPPSAKEILEELL